jgi:hypothetical protein
MLAPFYYPHRFNPVQLTDPTYDAVVSLCELSGGRRTPLPGRAPGRLS